MTTQLLLGVEIVKLALGLAVETGEGETPGPEFPIHHCSCAVSSFSPPVLMMGVNTHPYEKERSTGMEHALSPLAGNS